MFRNQMKVFSRSRLLLIVAVLVALLLHNDVVAFAPLAAVKNGFRHRANPLFPTFLPHGCWRATREDTNSGVDQVLLDEVRSMRVKELKAELALLRISSADVFEKEELVQRLYQARKQQGRNEPAAGKVDQKDVIRAPLFYASMDGTIVDRGGIALQPIAQPYAAMQIELEDGYKLTLLLDTACSGLVLRPSVVRTHNLPSYQTPVTMTAAGGTNSNTGLSQVNKFVFGNNSYGPMPAAVQDIGALPSTLDGIMGLSFLNQFACVEMDFRDGTVALYKTERRPPVPQGLQVVAEAVMSPTRLGIWTVDVMIDGRGPVKMLVDTGAATSFLSWKGVSDLSLNRESPEVSRISGMGAMGADNVAMKLTHRYVTKQFNLGRASSLPGYVSRDDGVAIDIGDIAVLETLKADNVGGILGLDLLRKFVCVQMVFNGPLPRISFLS